MFARFFVMVPAFPQSSVNVRIWSEALTVAQDIWKVTMPDRGCALPSDAETVLEPLSLAMADGYIVALFEIRRVR